MLSKAVLLTGGAGFIGTHLAARLRSRHPDIKIVSLDIQPPRYPVPDVDYRNVDLRQPIPSDLGVETFETIYNLAAVHRTPGHEDHEYYETNVAGAVHTCELASKLAVSNLVFVSSISVYGPRESALTEASALAPDGAYGSSKLLAEKIHRSWCERDVNHKLRIVRPGVIFGPEENGNFTRLAKAMRSGIFFYPGRKDTIKACGYVKDLSESILFAVGLEQKYFVYNFCYPEPTSIEDICHAIHRVSGFRLPLARLPSSLLLSIAALLEYSRPIHGISSISRARVKKLMASTNIVPENLTKAGFTGFTPLEEALREWFAESFPHGA